MNTPRVLLVAVALFAFAAGEVEAAVRLTILPEPVPLDEYGPRPQPRTAGSDSVSDALLMPYYEVGPEAGNLQAAFAVRNESAGSVTVRVLYLTLRGEEQASEEFALAPQAVRTIELATIPGLRRRGMVVLGAVGARGDLISGDYRLSNRVTGEATSGALLNVSLDDAGNELCAEWSARLSTVDPDARVRLVADWPQGVSPVDPPTAVGTVYDEAGVALQSFEVRSAVHSLTFNPAELLPPGVEAGSVVVRFLSAPGALLVEGAQGGAFKGACRDGTK